MFSCLYLCAPQAFWCLQRLERVSDPLETGYSGSCELSGVVSGNQLLMFSKSNKRS